MATTHQIVDYLKKHGKMSCDDICDDVPCVYLDVQDAEMDGLIRRTRPLCGGGGTWYEACTTDDRVYVDKMRRELP